MYTDEKLVAAVPVLEKSRGRFRVAAMPPLVPFYSPLLNGELSEATTHQRNTPLDALLTELERLHQATLQLHPTISDTRPFSWRSWALTPRYTYVADLSTEDPMAAWSTSARYNARKDVDTFTIEEEEAFATDAINLMIAGYERKGDHLKLGVAAINKAASLVHQSGLAKSFAARDLESGEIEAAAIIAEDGENAYFWMSGSNRGNALTVLVAHLFEVYKARGFHSFDFVGANVPSIAEFKRTLGGKLQVYYQAKYIGHPALRLLHKLRAS